MNLLHTHIQEKKKKRKRFGYSHAVERNLILLDLNNVGNTKRLKELWKGKAYPKTAIFSPSKQDLNAVDRESIGHLPRAGLCYKTRLRRAKKGFSLEALC